MDRYRLKNIIILILLLVNLFLVGSLWQRSSTERSTYRNTVEQIASLFAADGITLHTDAIPRRTPPQPRTLTRSPDVDRMAAIFFLGEALSSADEGGGITAYTGSRGSALFRANGSFELLLTDDVREGRELCREFCREFAYDTPESRLDSHGNGTIRAVRLWEKDPVYNCSVTFRLENYRVTRVTGTLLPTQSSLLAAEEPLTALAALTAFQQVRRETGAVVTDVLEVSFCYELQSTTTVPLSLIPAWRIVTNTADYYVNAITGAVQLS